MVTIGSSLMSVVGNKLTGDKLNDYNMDKMLAILAQVNKTLENISNPQDRPQCERVSQQEIQARYEQGYQAWLADNYITAVEDFSWLTLHRPLEPHFHLALAGALQMQQEFILALSAYASALLLEAKSPGPVYQMAVCLHAIKRDADAREALQMVIEMSYMRPEYAPMAEKANILLGKV